MFSLALPPPPGLRVATIALFLDVDGTLVEIEREPGAVHVPDQLFSPLRLSAAGLHGLERRKPAGEVVRAEPDPAILAAARRRLGAFAAQHEGVMLEDKGPTLALHYRKAPEQQAAAAALVREVVAASAGALMLLEGKMVLELKPPGCDKGQAIAAYMAEAPFAGRQAVFAGDDVTDEAGFAIVNRIGGVSIRIGADQRPTAASYGHEDVGAMQNWLVGLRAPAATPGRSA